MKIDDFEGAISEFEQILSIFATQLDSCQRFGEEVDETNLHLATTLHNIGIVHLLSKNFEDSIQLFERALKIFESNNDDGTGIGYIVREISCFIFLYLYYFLSLL